MQGQPPLVLIFGLPRSGTTWLGKIFDSHPRTLYRHEPDNFPRLESLPRFPSPAEADAYVEFCREFVAELPRLNDVDVAAKLPLFPKAWRGRVVDKLLQASAITAKLGDRARLKLPVLGARGDRIKPSPTIVWKSIESLGRFGVLMRALDQARGIHLIRHPCGQINSVLKGERQGAFQNASRSSEYSKLFKQLLGTPQAKRRGLTLNGLWQLEPEERLAWHWVIINEKAVEDVNGLDHTRVVRYEDLCNDPEKVAKDLFKFASLDWNEQTVEFLRRSTLMNNDAYYSVFKAPAKSAGAWREELPDSMAERILAIAGQSHLGEIYGAKDVCATVEETGITQ